MNVNDFVFQPDLALATTIPSRWYTDPAMLSLEAERVFGRTWQLVGRSNTVRRAVDCFICSTADEPPVVTGDTAGQLHAFYNVCRHRAGSVAEGCGNRKTLQCLYHAWTYGLDGQLLHTPEFEGVRDFDTSQYGLRPVQVGTWGPFVFANLDPDAPPLAE